MNIPNWIHGYINTPAGASLREAVTAGEDVCLGQLGAEAFAYRDRWVALQDDLQTGSPVPREHLSTTSRSLVDDAQADSVAKGRVDLHDALKALTALPGGAGDFYHELLSANPDQKLLARLSAPFHGNVSFETDGRQSTATLHFRGGSDWPEALGGQWTSERMRTITVNCRYAKWRDRRVRRLTRVQVVAKDVVPAS